MRTGLLKFAFAAGPAKVSMHQSSIKIIGFSFDINAGNHDRDIHLYEKKNHFATFDTVHFIKKPDRSSIGLIASLCEGKIAKDQTILDFGDMFNDELLIEESYIFTNAHLISFRKEMREGGDILEHFSMGFSSIQMIFHENNVKGQSENTIDYTYTNI